MRKLISSTSVCCVLSLACLPTPSRAASMFANSSQGGGNSWTNAIWKTNNTGTAVGWPSHPTPGNTYTYLPNAIPFGNNLGNARTRNPVSSPTITITFGGDWLMMTTNTEIRTKNITSGATGVPTLNFPGVDGNPGLILDGGVLNVGDDGVPTITGKIQVTGTSFICPGDNGAGTAVRAARAFTIAGQLTGSGSLVILQTPTNLAQTISGTSNTFSGQWFVKAGRLLGATTDSLGTNSITVDPGLFPPPPMNPTVAATNGWFAGPAVLEVNYTLNSAGVLTLTNGGIMRLHQSTVFSAAYIEGTQLTLGTHYYAELQTNFPNNFELGGSGAITIQPYGVPPPLGPTIMTQPLPQMLLAGATARFTVAASANGAPPLTYQWQRNGTNLIDSGNITGSKSSMLIVANVSAADAGGYDVVVGNTAGYTTSSTVALTLVSASGEAYEGAVLAAGPVAFYQLNETGDPATNNSPAFDFAGGYIGVYGTPVQNGNPTYNIAGPRPGDGFPGFGAGNTAAQFANASPGARITVLPWQLNTNTVTITAWINPNAVQANNNGLAYCRGGTTVVGLGYGGDATLNYNWNNEQPTYGWSSGLIPPQNQWSLVALVVTPTNATMYLLNTSGLAASSHVYTHVNQAFEGTTVIGDDPFDGGNGARAFAGIIDDVAVFNQALSQSQIVALYSAASGVASFAPSIAIPPASVTLYQGQTAQFTGLAIGSTPLTYQWQAGVNGSGIYTNITDGGRFSGSATPTLTIRGVDMPNALDYIVWVTNSAGATTSPPPATLPPATLTVLATNPAENIIITNMQAAGLDWDTADAVTSWLDGLGATTSAAAKPGSTYEVMPGARLRSPLNPTVAAFPGQVLTVSGDGVWVLNPAAGATIGEIRFKQPTYGSVNGTVVFPKLRMNGGQLDAGNDNMLIIGGEIDILTNAPFNNDGGNDRGYRIDAWLTGSGSIEYHGYNQARFMTAYSNNLNIACTSNTFSGSWTVVAGTLLGTGANSLGTNNIFVGTNAALETTYNIGSSNAVLVLNGKMFLHQDDTFKSALINGVSLAPGSHSFAALNASYPANFPATWTPQVGATSFSTGSGSITVLVSSGPVITLQPQSQTVWGQQNAQFIVSATGNPPLAYQWRAGTPGSGVYTNLSDAGNISGSSTTNLAITSVVPANGLDYVVVVTNVFGAATSTVATLTVRPEPLITSQPQSLTLYEHQTAQFGVGVLGVLPQLYRWQAGASGSGIYTSLIDGGKFSGTTTTNLTITDIGFENAGDYILTITNAGVGVVSTVATLTVLATNPPENITMSVQQAQNVWWENGPDWSDGLAASVSSAFKPGSTYEILPGARMRTPTNVVYSTFPGNVLTVQGDGVYVNNGSATIGEIRFKHTNPGTVHFKKLVMNGGQLDSGDNGLLTISGEIAVLANTPFYDDSGSGQDRPFQIDAWLTGSGSIEWHAYSASFAGNLNITGTSNTFSGKWNVVQGALLGSGTNSLGTNDITVGANGALETLYDVNSPGANLVLNGQMFLHQNDTFRSALIGSVGLAPGTHTFAELSAAYPANFPASWPLQTGSSISTGSGSLTVSAPPPGVISLQFNGSSLQLSWSPGTLLEATNILGPWTTNNATSPYTVNPTEPEKYYRVQLQ